MVGLLLIKVDEMYVLKEFTVRNMCVKWSVALKSCHLTVREFPVPDEAVPTHVYS